MASAPAYAYTYEASLVAVEAGAHELPQGRRGKSLATLIEGTSNIHLVDEDTTTAWVKLSPVDESRLSVGLRATFEDSPELDTLIDALNASSVTQLSVHIRRVVLLPSADGPPTQVSACYCPSKALEAVLTRLFARLRLPSLRALYLQSGQQVPTAPLAAFLSSSSSAHLSELTLSPYFRTVDSLALVLDAIKSRHHALSRVSLGGRKLGSWDDEWAEYGCCACAWFARMAAPPDPAKPLLDELDKVLQARGSANARVRRAFRASLTPARVLLNARPASRTPTGLNIADLPGEVLADIVRACGDEQALSDSQFAALCRLSSRDEAARLASANIDAVKLATIPDPVDPDAPGPSSAPMTPPSAFTSPEAKAAFGTAMEAYLASAGFWWDRALPAPSTKGMSAWGLSAATTPAAQPLVVEGRSCAGVPSSVCEAAAVRPVAV
ncbi:uncharacterized protein LOC62_04G005384 [Vanrija pseudolonga]|uniref:Uncharacterized protein n=1 Tax=Vanrija pseudolonga TaxID=143232 RepID=A0AAF1BR91_9TREE|nr:hypothetical protein LOC62_04G005384 [Vanrija pseudolonga]